MDYPGKVITKTQVTPTQTSASGNWTLDDQAAAIKNNNWPVALVPNPISKSLRFNSADSAYLNRTPASASNRKTWTWSGWIKRTNPGTLETFFSGGTVSGDTTHTNMAFSATDFLFIASDLTSWRVTTQVFRDPSAWYHIVYAVDTTQATANNRIRIYVNGSEITAFQTTNNPSQNADLGINSATAHNIGRRSFNSDRYMNGYMTEVNLIDGQALTPSSFGMTNPQTGQWIPLKYSGTYGTNGFYLNFKDATSTTTLGYDYSGNANNWTTNNFSVTAGAGNDSLTDVPTPWFAYNTTGDVGGVIRGNYATLNPLSNLGSTFTFTNGNLDCLLSAGDKAVPSTMLVSSGKWYCEMTITAVGSGGSSVGLIPTIYAASAQIGNSTDSYAYRSSGNKRTNSTDSAYGASYTTNDVIGIALDLDAGTLVFYKNGTTQGTAFSSISGAFAFAFSSTSSGSTTSVTANFGQRAFAYTPPTGFRSLCTTNLPATAIGFGLTNQGDDYFNAVLYSGNGTSQTIDTGLQPDFIWIKRRNGAAAHTLTDSVRGISKQLFTNLTDAEQTDADSGVTAISSSSITLGDNNLAVGSVNGSGSTYVAWNWKAGGTGVSNTAGTITSTVSANTTAGFSIATWTNPGSTQNITVGHGLGVAPSMIIVKQRSGAGGSWPVWHIGLTGGASNSTYRLYLDLTNAQAAVSNVWGSAAPTSSVFGVGVGVQCDPSTNMVAYCFAAVPGYSAFGSYTGNGSTDGPFVYLGFRPRFVIIKRTDVANNWLMEDSARSTYNAVQDYLLADSSAAEANASSQAVDFLSNGFKPRNTANATNASGGTFIYMAFAESPFQFSNAR